MTKRVEERINEGLFRWFGHIERMVNDRIAKRVYVGECASSCSVGRTWKRWIDEGKHDRSVRRGFVRRCAWDVARRMNP